jgi:ERCC4-related helicase
VPEAQIRVGHGQMRERDLEQLMLDFYHQRFNVLLCTTIIESGIDVPSANTIIINRADRFGLAQLHQLRGRVGRSHHRAFAYLIVPRKALTRTRRSASRRSNRWKNSAPASCSPPTTWRSAAPASCSARAERRDHRSRLHLYMDCWNARCAVPGDRG